MLWEITPKSLEKPCETLADDVTYNLKTCWLEKSQVSTSMDQLESNHAPFAFRALGCFVSRLETEKHGWARKDMESPSGIGNELLGIVHFFRSLG